MLSFLRVLKVMTKPCLTVGISSRALFDLAESHAIFEQKGINDYAQYQIEHENEILKPGVAFSLVKKLLQLNTIQEQFVEVILLSRNSGDTGLRIFNSIEYYCLPISRAAFTSGTSPYNYIPAFGVDLFLSSHSDDVRQTLEAGYAAARILSGKTRQSENNCLKVAFDGDAVLFSDESEKISKLQGLEAFTANEEKLATQPLNPGPFKNVLEALHQIQNLTSSQPCIRTALVTARSAPAHKRVLLTLREWGVRVDESVFLGGREKGPFLAAFGADIFFDDQKTHCESASEHVTSGHVVHGVSNPK